MNSTKKKWWQDKVAYQIYPKSFYDTNGDGIGDLPGIIEKLDYLKELGVDIVWLSPCYRSPLADQGYDISDYYDIDPRFGTMEDMDRLIAEAKKRDMYIVMDLVVNHCSDEHEWFKKACKDPDGKYGRFFYLRDKEDGKLPTNWRSYFGGSVWEDLPGTNKQYLHVFHKKQPDLNWENPELREEVYKNINWWLDKGLGGFRIDAIINIKKALPMHDYEPDREDGLCSINKMLEEASGIGEFLGEMRDHETIQTAMTAAETGHLILSSLHTTGAANTISRIMDVFEPSQQHQIAIQLSMVLQTVISQQLVPDVNGHNIPVFEIMRLTPAIRNMIRDNKIYQIDGVIASSSQADMKSMDNSLLELYRNRQITRETALKYSSNPEMLKRKLI